MQIAIKLLKACYPNQPLTERNGAAYIHWMKKIADDELMLATEHAIKLSPKWMPTPQMIVTEWLDRDLAFNADLEFNIALQHCERHGIATYPSTPALALSAAAMFAMRQIGGRAGILHTAEQWTDKLRERFTEAYRKFIEAERAGHLLAQPETLRLLGMVPIGSTPQLTSGGTKSKDDMESLSSIAIRSIGQ